MKNVKKMVAAATMMAAMVFGTTLANAGGIIIAGAQAEDPCTDTTNDFGLGGIIIAGVVAVQTGIIIAGADSSNDTCGIIIAG
ncbi:MAG TPA: hypothetical protein VJ781_01225 [Pyrinomonadaceae bacterium]|jgi:hypothetical protein|nr:hypothetical protein [Pyrinomonadaceae bacterium]